MPASAVPPTDNSDPRAMGVITKMLSRVLGHMPAADRTALMQDAATLSSTELGKAEELAKTVNMAAVGAPHSGFISDHWSDESMTEVPSITHVQGPGSSVPSGSLNAGSPQMASGSGAAPMEREYSRVTSQVGNTASAEQLGRELVALRGAVKSIITSMQGMHTQMEVLKSSATVDVPAVIDAAVAKAVSEAIAKAMGPIKASLIAKAADGKDDAWKDEDEDAKAAALIAKADSAKTKADRENENDDDGEMAKAASELRVMAETHVDHARLRISKALDYVAEGKAKAAQRALVLAKANIAKAGTLVIEAQALRDGKTGLSTQLLLQNIAKANQGIAASIAENQDIWPNTGDTEFGEKPKSASTPAAAPAPDLAKAMAQIEAAASGMGMLQASVSDMMQALSSKPTVTQTNGEQTALPPVFALAKAGAADINSREAELTRLRDSSVISFDDYDRARDTLTRVRMKMPPDVIQAMVDRLPDAAKAVLSRGAA